MRVSRGMLKQIAEWEGVELTAYKDPVGVLTIGIGHTAMAGEPDVWPGMRITREQAFEILDRDIRKFSDGVEALLDRKPTQYQFDAMVSLAFNIGLGGFKRSTVLRLFNAGDLIGAAEAFKMWNKAGGKILRGLVRRRDGEAEWFLRSPDGAAQRDPAPEAEAQKTPDIQLGFLAALLALLRAFLRWWR